MLSKNDELNLFPMMHRYWPDATKCLGISMKNQQCFLKLWLVTWLVWAGYPLGAQLVPSARDPGWLTTVLIRVLPTPPQNASKMIACWTAIRYTHIQLLDRIYCSYRTAHLGWRGWGRRGWEGITLQWSDDLITMIWGCIFSTYLLKISSLSSLEILRVESQGDWGGKAAIPISGTICVCLKCTRCQAIP